jgi:hypothetical protein
MAVPAYKNTNGYTINVPNAEGVGITIPSNKYVAGPDFANYVGVIEGFVLAYPDSASVADQDDIVYYNESIVGPFGGASGYSGKSGFSGYSGSGISGYSGESNISGYSGFSGYSGKSGYSGISGYSGESNISGYSGFSGYSGVSGYSGYSGKSGYSGAAGGITSVGADSTTFTGAIVLEAGAGITIGHSGSTIYISAT